MNKALRLTILEKFDSQAKFAKEIGVDNTKISMVLHGYRKLRPKEASKWIVTLNCDPSLLKPITKIEV